MARFDVFNNSHAEGCLLDVQADLLSHLNTRIVVPLLPRESAPLPAGTLNPVFCIGENSLVMVTQFMAAVPLSILKSPVANLQQHRDEVVAAVDFVMQGF
ncbi:MAG: CcdB family protein [Pelovirga sp.]